MSEKGERALVLTLTKRSSEDLADYLRELKFKVRYIHSELNTFERAELIRDLRKGDVQVLVGINLLREGMDLPEVTLVAILDADREGYLRSYIVDIFFVKTLPLLPCAGVRAGWGRGLGANSDARASAAERMRVAARSRTDALWGLAATSSSSALTAPRVASSI